jgi:hypothetical protein
MDGWRGSGGGRRAAWLSGAAVASVVVCLSGGAPAAFAVTSTGLKGLTAVEARVTVPADGTADTDAHCPGGHWVVGGGAYQVTQGLGEFLSASTPTGKATWAATFNDTTSSGDTGVVVAICATVKSMSDYSIQQGDPVLIPADGTAQATVTCPAGTVSLGGGAYASNGYPTGYAINSSAPYGTNGWRSYLVSQQSQPGSGQAFAVCASEPAGWQQVASAYVPNPANTATTVSVDCPAGTEAIGGGPFTSNTGDTVSVGLTTPLNGFAGWNSTEDNGGSSANAVDEWAVCAEATT